MPFLQAQNISFQFSNGDRLFHQLSCAMNVPRVGLVGRNGVGKSMLASILLGEKPPESGNVLLPSSYAMYRQQPSNLACSIAEFLGKAQAIEALRHIEIGDCSPHWFEVVGDEWDIEQKLYSLLNELGLPRDCFQSCGQLSGGQLARLQLWKLFTSDTELLILDEPSNHLDTQGKLWLIQAMRDFSGAIFLISHDRELLREVDEIWQLSDLGLKVFGGNYDFYKQQNDTERQALERQILSVEKQQKKLKQQAQCEREKAQQREAQGNRLRRDGSQPKLLLDGKKDKATARASNRNKNVQLRKGHLQKTEQALRTQYEQLKQQKLYLSDQGQRTRRQISIVEGVLPFVRQPAININLSSQEKIHLHGINGSGKSTLLKVIAGDLLLLEGELAISTPVKYLDQNFATVDPEETMLDNVMNQCEGVLEADARTLLAGIGFRRDSVFRLGKELSGGEKMKLAMLIVSHQPNQPLLLLDEPDNHLDLESKELLAQALQSYQGGFMLVSHDQDFVSESGVVRQIELSNCKCLEGVVSLNETT